MNDAQRRAEERRRTYEGSIVRAGTPKPRLRGASFTMERLEAMWELCVTQFEASGRALPTFTRSEMPGEIFRIERPCDGRPSGSGDRSARAAGPPDDDEE